MIWLALPRRFRTWRDSSPGKVTAVCSDAHSHLAKMVLEERGPVRPSTGSETVNTGQEGKGKEDIVTRRDSSRHQTPFLEEPQPLTSWHKTAWQKDTKRRVLCSEVTEALEPRMLQTLTLCPIQAERGSKMIRRLEYSFCSENRQSGPLPFPGLECRRIWRSKSHFGGKKDVLDGNKTGADSHRWSRDGDVPRREDREESCCEPRELRWRRQNRKQ